MNDPKDKKRKNEGGVFPRDVFPEDIFPEDVFPSDIFPRGEEEIENDDEDL